MREKLDGITALRGLACLGVFAAHASKAFNGFGPTGVSLFLIVSGFGMIYGYYGTHRIKDYSVGGNLRFAFSKIQKIYSLHFLTTMAVIPFLFVGQVRIAAARVAVTLGLNMLLIENWLPLDLGAINAVAWYLCTCAFTYFLFPWILRFMEQKQTVRKAKVSICALIFSQFVIGLIGRQLQNLALLSGGWFGTQTTRWFVYQFPPTRAIDFLIGCNLGYLFISHNDDREKRALKWQNVLPILAGGGDRHNRYGVCLYSSIFELCVYISKMVELQPAF